MRQTRFISAAVLLLLGGLTARGTPAAHAGEVQKNHAEVLYAGCTGDAPDFGSVLVGLWRASINAQPEYSNVAIYIRTHDGIQDLWYGIAESTGPEPPVWTATTVDASMPMQDAPDIPDLGIGEVHIAYTLGDPVTVRNAGDGPGTSQNYVETTTERDITDSSGYLVLDGVRAAELTCNGAHVVQDIQFTSPSVWIYNDGGYSLQWCTATNSTSFAITELSGEVLVSFTTDYADQPGITAVAPRFRLSSGRWDGRVQLTGPNGPLGTADAWATLKQVGSTEHLGMRTPQYVAELAFTRHELAIHANGVGSPVDATCEVIRVRVWTRFENGS